MNKRDLKSLCAEKRYEDIYLLYGGEVYRKKTPISYQMRDIMKLLREERYYAIYEKYGDTIYSGLLPYIKNCDIKNEIGYNPAFREIKAKIKASILSVVVVCLILNTVADATFIGILSSKKDEYKGDEETIAILDEYDESLNAYAEYINGLKLSDLDVIVKVMSDMWDNIYGYNENVEGYSNDSNYSRLAIYTYGYGVCRHMADDFTARMNAINPEYNAYNMTVYMRDDLELNDIERFWFPSELPEGEEEAYPVIMDFIRSKVGNHMVTCLTIPKTNIKLVVDVTNPSIGILRNGLVTMLTQKKVPELTPMHDSNIGYKWQDKEELVTYLTDLLQSYFIPYDVAKLRELYGTEAQNEALERILKFDSSHYKINPINTSNEEEDKGKTPLYYNGYSIKYEDGAIRFCTISDDTRALDKASYHEINNFLRAHSDTTQLSFDYDDGTIDFARIDFSLLDDIDTLSIVCNNTGSCAKELVIEGEIDKLTLEFKSQVQINIGSIALRTTGARTIRISLSNNLVSDGIHMALNDNTEVVEITSQEATDYKVEEHSGIVKTNYYSNGILISDETSYAKRIRHVLS